VRGGRNRYDVVFYVPWIGPLLAQRPGLSTGGAETQVFLLSRALARLGLRVCLFAFEIPGVHTPSAVDGVDVALRPPYKSRQRLLGKVRETVNIHAALASVQAEAVVTRSAGPHVGLLGVFSRDQRFVFSSASPLDFDFIRIAPKHRDRVLFALGMRLADEIVVQTEEQLESCRHRLGRTPVLIRSICEPADVGTATPDAFLWVGRYNAYKRPLEYVELARALPEAHFRMVASSATLTPEAAETKRRVEEAANVLPNLELLHSLPRAELMGLVERAVAVVSTSEFEGTSNALLEAWARGVPALVFSYDSDGVVERHDLGHVAGGSRPLLVEQAREVWAKRFERSELSSRCREYVEEHHAPEPIAERWARVLVGGSDAFARRSVASEAA
jgi:glycosyltransferase involved in cell wall biosynthesis